MNRANLQHELDEMHAQIDSLSQRTRSQIRRRRARAAIRRIGEYISAVCVIGLAFVSVAIVVLLPVLALGVLVFVLRAAWELAGQVFG